MHFTFLFPLGLIPDGPLLLTLDFPDELTADGPGLNFGLQFQSQQLRNRHLPLRFVLEPHEVARQLQQLASAFKTGLPQ